MTSTIPTVRLRRLDRPALLDHFTALDVDDRRLRFGSASPDEVLRQYVDRIDFEHDGLFAVHDELLDVVAVVHVAVGNPTAELGLSVLPGWRDHGVGHALFARAVTFLRNRGVRRVFVHCLAENAAMIHLARSSGMRLATGGGESDGFLELGPATADTYITEWMEDQRGLAMRTLRQNTRNALAFFGG